MIHILDSTSDFILIDKPPGAPFHHSSEQAGIVERVRTQTNLNELYAVHRLDTPTSGLLLFARSPMAASALSALFRDGQVEKYYCALSDKKPRKKQGLICGDIVPSRRGSWKLTRNRANPAKTAFFSYSLQPGIRFFLLRLYTGKTHQARVSLKSIGAPILGDPRYHPKGAHGDQSDRMYLHALGIRFRLFEKEYQYICHPKTGTLFENCAVLHERLLLDSPWELGWT